mgnify:CR=1 FL=1
MTEQENKEIMNLVDTIKGEVNRMCVTKELEELDSMMQHARNNIEKLGVMIYRAKFAEGSDS